MLKTLLAELGQLVFPKLCVGCKGPLTQVQDLLCISCHKYLPLTGPYHPNNETEKIFLGRVPLLAASCLLFYQKDGLTQNLIHALKYQGNTEVAKLLGKLMAQHLQDSNWPLQNVVLVPVPLTAKRLQQRGYNQSLLLAEAIGQELEIPVSDEIIFRTRDTETQTKKSRLERLKNMDGAFEIKNQQNFENKLVIIIDDVVTSGATLEACILAFKDVKNINISVLCAAMATETF